MMFIYYLSIQYISIRVLGHEFIGACRHVLVCIQPKQQLCLTYDAIERINRADDIFLVVLPNSFTTSAILSDGYEVEVEEEEDLYTH
jgi:hypothetical protein